MDFSTVYSILEGLPGQTAYLLLFGLALLENLFPPFPGDMVAVFGGYLAGTGRLQIVPVLLAATCGGWAGFMVLYALGRLLEHSAKKGPAGKGFFGWLGRIGSERTVLERAAQERAALERAALERAIDWLARHGLFVVAANRFLTGVRSVIALAAGLLALPWGAVALLSGLSSLLWHLLLVGAGFRIGENWGEVSVFLIAYNRVVLAVLVLVALVLLIRYLLTRK
ncbi:MAG: VTT domain-containing protein [Deltaproteobacteria bacterium]|nr:VTT domain-containing protein [Deltaproteobacteria bacterium]